MCARAVVALERHSACPLLVTSSANRYSVLEFQELRRNFEFLVLVQGFYTGLQAESKTIGAQMHQLHPLPRTSSTRRHIDVGTHTRISPTPPLKLTLLQSTHEEVSRLGGSDGWSRGRTRGDAAVRAPASHVSSASIADQTTTVTTAQGQHEQLGQL